MKRFNRIYSAGALLFCSGMLLCGGTACSLHDSPDQEEKQEQQLGIVVSASGRGLVDDTGRKDVELLLEQQFKSIRGIESAETRSSKGFCQIRLKVRDAGRIDEILSAAEEQGQMLQKTLQSKRVRIIGIRKFLSH